MWNSSGRSFLLSLVLSAASSSALAEDALPEDSPPRSVTLEEALAYARAHQPAVQAARARVAAARADAEVPRAQWRPQVGATAQIFGATANNTTASYASNTWLDIPRIGATRAVSNARTWTPYASTFVAVGVGQEIFDFGRIAAQSAAADALAEVEIENAQVELLDLEISVRESFYAVEAAKAVVIAAEGAFDRSRAHRDLAKAGVDSGLRPPIELTRALADLGRFDVGRVRARGGLRTARSVLAASVGAQDLELDTTGAVPAADDLPSLQSALSRASERDPAVRSAMSRVRAAEERTHAIAAEMRPEIQATATLSGRAGAATPTSGDVPTGNGLLPYVPNWDIGLVLTWPIYDGVTDAKASAARVREDVSRADLGVLKQQQVAAVQQVYVAVQVARIAVPGLERALAAAVDNLKQADARFTQGIGTSVELADAEALRTDAEIQLALGRFEVARSRAQLGRVIAEGL